MAEIHPEPDAYRLDDQVGYILRLVSQRHASIFQSLIEHDVTPTQFAMLIRLAEVGQGSQNHLGRLAAMDVATAKGVVDRLKAKGLITLAPDENDARRRVIRLSAAGERLIADLEARGHAITEATLAPLSKSERRTFLALLGKLI